MGFFAKLFPSGDASGGGGPAVHADTEASDSEPYIIRDGDLAYTRVKGGNGSKPSYQEAVGAPVESDSPLGYHVNWIAIIFLNINMMVGTGVFSTPASILNRTGSIGLALMYWVIGFLMASAGFSVYLELASYFPNRSGSEVVYLEQAYPRPRHFFPVAFAVQSVILSFSSSNAVVLSRYLWRMANITPSEWQMRGVAIAAYTLAVICVIAHNRYSLWLVNFIGVLKILTLVFNGNDLSSALVSIVFSYAGYYNAFNMTNEIRDPVPTLRRNGAVSLLVVAVLYMLCNVAYFAAVPKAEFAGASEIAAAVFFSKLFGASRAAANVLNFLVLLSAFGNLLAVLIGSSRMIREIGRCTPVHQLLGIDQALRDPSGPVPAQVDHDLHHDRRAARRRRLLLRYAPDSSPHSTTYDTFLTSFTNTRARRPAPPPPVVDLGTYPTAMFNMAMTLGVFVLRRRRRRSGIGRSEFRAWDLVVVFFLAVQVFVLAMPWWPPKGGPYAGSVSFWYATYCVVGIGIILLCVIYYIAWMYVFPRWLGYEIRTEVVDVDGNGANTHRLVRVPKADVAQWDEEHDEAGNLRRRRHAITTTTAELESSNSNEKVL
ncbi:putative high-affinity methionine permease [Colletotrichum sublineola]|uniref:Putative high-affinity methionine permease n=1 Tax=Colletotrichum sublineola TaxID=1173701 RepID=A0A066X0D4_COLSU|nr:putative high-affinity methionine permease [Colletotrichum sublineola]